jgi:hypothetical protein
MGLLNAATQCPDAQANPSLQFLPIQNHPIQRRPFTAIARHSQASGTPRIPAAGAADYSHFVARLLFKHTAEGNNQ